MSHLLSHPKGKYLLKRVAQAFRSSKTFVQRDSKIIFVCGGPVETDKGSMRNRFLSYAEKELPNHRMFLAESAEKNYVAHDEPEFHNVGEFEELIADVSDLVLIFPESPGSCAELGYFSKNGELRKKLLVVPDAKYQGGDSFISRGPVDLIDQHSRFKYAIQLSYDGTADFSQISGRIRDRIPNSRRRKVEFTEYSKLSARLRFFVIFEILRLFRALSFEEIVYAFKSVLGHAKSDELRQLLSILVAAGIAYRLDDGEQVFAVNANVKPFMEFDDFKVQVFQLEVMDFYTNNFSEHASLIARSVQ